MKYLFIAIITAIINLSPLFAQPTYAQASCNSVSINPTTGTTETNFEVSISGCPVTNSLTERVINTDTQEVIWSTPIFGGDFTSPLYRYFPPGNYAFQITSEAQVIGQATFSVRASDEPDPVCGEEIGTDDRYLCPTECPAEFFNKDGESRMRCSFCGDDGQACCPTQPACFQGLDCVTLPDNSTGTCLKLDYSEPEGPKIRCGPNNSGVNTALGCIGTNSITSLISQLLTIAIGVGGGLALLLMGYGVFIITTSAGIPEKISEGKSIITAAVFGLLFIVLSVVLFRILGVEILAIPGLQ